ncbi:hypothetical protein BLNAU_17351 [Blattamonas nauphoetae]|uniref:Uncharacterized protein n=1 Tax=Blattamonas nauphoetae TaxID=2049346 RepID=A0ABQ9X7F0_9EUKA|nr:hypothetical protein BLNAU_17351 [Blattamonas nauphoetae]
MTSTSKSNLTPSELPRSVLLPSVAWQDPKSGAELDAEYAHLIVSADRKQQRRLTSPIARRTSLLDCPCPADAPNKPALTCRPSSASLFLRHSAPTFLQLSLSFILRLPFSNKNAHLRHLNPTQERTSTSGSRLTRTKPHQQRHRSWKAWMSELKSRRQPTSSSCRAAPHVADKLSTVYVQTSLRLSTKDHPSPLHCQVTHSTLASPVTSPSFCPANGEDESVQETEVDSTEFAHPQLYAFTKLMMSALGKPHTNLTALSSSPPQSQHSIFSFHEPDSPALYLPQNFSTSKASYDASSVILFSSTFTTLYLRLLVLVVHIERGWKSDFCVLLSQPVLFAFLITLLYFLLPFSSDVLYSPTTAQVFVSGASCFLDGDFKVDYKLSDMDWKFDLNSAMSPVPFSSGVGDMLLKSCKFERTCILNSILVCDPLIVLDTIQTVTFQNVQFDDCVSSTLNEGLCEYETTTTLTVFIAIAECIAVQCGGSLNLKSVSMSGNGDTKGNFAPARKCFRCVSEGTANIASASGDGADAPLHWISGSESTIKKDDKIHASPLFVAELKNNESTSTLTKNGTINIELSWKWRLIFDNGMHSTETINIRSS